MSHTYKQKRNRLKGFTLIELIVVVAIIGVLLGVFIPTISGYMRRSRLKSANANSKLIFNSIQTICQELEFSERGDAVTTFYGSEDKKDSSGNTVMNNGEIVKTGITDGAMMIYSVDGVASVDVWLDNNHDGTLDTQASATHIAALADTLNDDSTRASFMNRMDRLFASNEDIAWVAYISGFQVQAVICADDIEASYVGAYPINTADTFRQVTKDAGLSGVNNIDDLMSAPTAFTDVRTYFVDPAWD